MADAHVFSFLLRNDDTASAADRGMFIGDGVEQSMRDFARSFNILH